MAKNRRRNSKKKAQYRRQRSPELAPVEHPPIEDLGSRRTRSILARVGVPTYDLYHLDILRRVWGLSWDGLTDRLVMRLAPEAMAQAVNDHFDFSGLELQATLSSKVGVILHREKVARAVIYPTRARLLGGSIRGDFTADGLHWSMLRTALLERRLPQSEDAVDASTAEVEVEAPAEARRVLVAFPLNVEEHFRARVLEASMRIRTERSLDYGTHPVVLEASDHVVRYEPIMRRDRAVELPFSFTQKGHSAIRGALRLRSPGDPLALVCSPDLGEDVLPLVWGSALIGFAELTCVAEAERPDDPVTRRRERQQPRGGSGRSRYLASGGSGSVGHSSPMLRPTAATADVLASYVAGHRRRLSSAAHPSDEARAAAADIGIVLGAHETWVRPHVRGVPTDAELRFRWVSPVSLAA